MPLALRLENMGAAFHIENFGCRAARADGEAIADRLRSAGHSLQQPGEADIVVVNTCSVTAEADRSARAFIRRTHRDNPAARIVVTGCYAQRAPEELAAMDGVAAVIGNSHKALAPEIVEQVLSPAPHHQLLSVASLMTGNHGNAGIWADDRFAHSFLEEAQLVPGQQTRPNLKIQEGCSNRCTFCIIPQTRGNSRSLTAEAVLKQIRGFIEAGGNELVLSGINLGRWGRDLPASDTSPRSLSALVRKIFQETDLPRLRLSSIEPMDWDADLVSLLREFGGNRLARHAHLPLQSGSDAVLRRMHRRYRPWHYEQKVQALMDAAGPDLTLGADVMVGFPGETDAEFRETYTIIERLPLGYLHLFPFSPRPGTPGWALHALSPVPHSAVEERMAALRTLAAEKSRRHRQAFVGKMLDVITLHTPPEIAAQDRTACLSENFLPVEVDYAMSANQLTRVRVSQLSEGSSLSGVICHSRALNLETSPAAR